jgi:hypothetical protein
MELMADDLSIGRRNRNKKEVHVTAIQFLNNVVQVPASLVAVFSKFK